MTSKVVNMAPCSDKKEGKMEVMTKEGRKEETEIGRLVRLQQERGAQQKGNLKVLKSKSLFPCHPEKSRLSKTERIGEIWLDGLFYINRKLKDCQTSHLEFSPGVKFLQALHSLLPVHHGSYSGSLLQEEGEMI